MSAKHWWTEQTNSKVGNTDAHIDVYLKSDNIYM